MKQVKILKVRDFESLFGQGYTIFIGDNFVYHTSGNTHDIYPTFFEKKDRDKFYLRLINMPEYKEGKYEAEEFYFATDEIYNLFFRYSNYTIEELDELL